MKTLSRSFGLLALSLALASFGCKKKNNAGTAGQTTGSSETGSAGSAETGSAGSAGSAEMGSAGSAEAGSAGSAAEAGSGSAAAGGTAEAQLKPTKGSKVAGTVTFTEKDGKTEVAIDLTGLTPGEHGFHIHEKGDCSAPDAKSAGGHFNPEKAEHGAPDAKVHHAGDLGNITADKAGNVKTTKTVDYLTVSDGANSVVGHAVIVHGNADDLKSQPSGNAGPRVACGVVEKK